MSVKKCQTIPAMTMILSISDEYVEFRHAVSSSISVRLKRTKCLGVKSCYGIATERIHISLKNSVRTLQRLSRTVLVEYFQSTNFLTLSRP